MVNSTFWNKPAPDRHKAHLISLLQFKRNYLKWWLYTKHGFGDKDTEYTYTFVPKVYDIPSGAFSALDKAQDKELEYVNRLARQWWQSARISMWAYNTEGGSIWLGAVQ